MWKGMVIIMQEHEKKGLLRLFFFLYIVILIKLIIFKYPWDYLMNIARNWEKGVIWEGLSTANFTLGKSIRMYIRYFPGLNGVENLFGNILAFVPYGFLLPLCWKNLGKWWKVFFWSMVLVLGIEFFQLFSAFGAFDVDDILLNVAGAMTGYLVYKIFYGRAVKR